VSFAEYQQHGWKLCAIPPGKKGPVSKGWNARDVAQPNPEHLLSAGLCHAYSGTCAIDIDNYERALQYFESAGLDLTKLVDAPDAVMVSSGRENRAKLLYSMPEPYASVKLAPYEMSGPKGKPQTYHAVEFRCATADGLTVQDVLPPSIHPDTGNPYTWVYGDSLLGHWSVLPPIPEKLLALWTAALAPKETPVVVAPQGVKQTELDRLLLYKDPDMPYDEWVKAGMAIHHETQGSEDGFQSWNTWSSRGAKYQGPADLRTHWRSFDAKKKGGVTVNSLKAGVPISPDEFDIEEAPKGAPPAPRDTRPQAVIAELLEPRLVYVKSQDCYFDLEAKGEPWCSDKALRHLFAPHIPAILIPGKDGKSDTVKSPDPVQFLMKSATKKVTDAAGFHPGAERFYTEDGVQYVNRFLGFDKTQLKPTVHETDVFNFIWSRMDDHIMQQWLLSFYAHMVQKPGVKIRTAPLLVSEATATGKNTIAYNIPRLLFSQRYMSTITNDILSGQFNDPMAGAWVVYIEELRAGTTRSERDAVTNKIKSWITDPYINIHPKGLKPYTTVNRVQVTATSNYTDALQLDNNDRRWAITHMRAPLGDKEVYEIYNFLNSDRAPGVLHYIFGNHDITGFNPNARAPFTRGKKVMVLAGMGASEQAIVDAVAGGKGSFGYDIVREEDFRSLLEQRYWPGSAKFGNMVAKEPFGFKRVRTPSGIVYVVRNATFWESRTGEAMETYLATGERPDGGVGCTNGLAAGIIEAHTGDVSTGIEDLL
jgi:hypothetical protein